MQRTRFSAALGITLSISLTACIVSLAGPGNAWAGTEKVLYSFQGGSDAARPYGPLSFDKKGNLFGTSQTGGTVCGGCGTIFELQPSKGGWTEKVIYSFTGAADGNDPSSGVIFDKQGNLYAATGGGGNAGCYEGGGCGAVIELKPSGSNWTETTLYTFNQSDGGGSVSPLVLDSAGNLYGTGLWGGNAGCDFGCGSVFELSRSGSGWTENTLYRFTDGIDGAEPFSSSQLLYKGNLYGAFAPPTGFGPTGGVFELKHSKKTGWKDETLYTFPIDSNGDTWAGIVFDAAGNIYGTTTYGGANGSGTLYKLTHSGGVWTFTTLYTFTGGSDGANPWASLTLDMLGNIYGTARAGGLGYGVVFELQNCGGNYTYKTLYTFSGGADGAQPTAPVLLRRWKLYGSTNAGGTSGAGVVYEVTP